MEEVAVSRPVPIERTAAPMRRDRGAALVMTLLVCLAICAAVTSALVPVLTDVVHRQQAQAAADAAALAGVSGGRAASSRLASANDGVLVSWSQRGHEVTVTVQVGGQSATARATDAP
jgi:predicted MarR family transcription regulator